MQTQSRSKMPLGELLNAIDSCKTISALFNLVHSQGIVIQMRSQSSASNLNYKPLPKNPNILPLDTLKKQLREAAIEDHRRHTKEQLIRAVQTCPTIDKLFELVKNEHIVIRMKSFNSASNLPQNTPSGPDLMPDKSPLDRLKERVIEAVMYAN
ncbi:MAG: hypothetical protein IJS27_02150 [Ruminococcus sp.]|nr:hypothetical protein [Ruminococcus sp.]